MSKPIGQTFYVQEPPQGTPGIFLTRVDVFFQRVSTEFGIELQIRECENGVPTPRIVPFGTKLLETEDTIDGDPAIVASADASAPTRFIFETPVFLESNRVYAIVLVPVGGNPDYLVWSGKLGDQDLLTNRPIYKNNASGNFFISSNDLAWTPIQNEDMKYTLYHARFTSTSGTAVFSKAYSDFFKVSSESEFSTMQYERTACTKDEIRTAHINVVNVGGTFTGGMTVYQANSTTNVATGVVVSANSTVLRVSNTTGVFNTSNVLFGTTTSINAQIDSVLQNVVTDSTNTISVPYSSVYTTNTWIYVSRPDRLVNEIVKVTSIPSNTTIQVDRAITFSNTSCIIGNLVGGSRPANPTWGYYVRPSGGTGIALVENIRGANSTENFYISNGSILRNQFLIGRASKASVRIIGSARDMPYDTVTPQFAYSTPRETNIDWGYRGVEYSTSRTYDGGYRTIAPEEIRELVDKPRLSISYSRELTDGGASSIRIRTQLATGNNRVSPTVDTIRSAAFVTQNMIVPNSYLTGYYLTLANTTASILSSIGVDDANLNEVYFQQGSNTGRITDANSVFAIVSNPTGEFTPGQVVTLVGNDACNSTILTAEWYDESLDNGHPRSSRSVSKSVILGEGQDAEDLRCYFTAHRPARTDLRVFARLQNAEDLRKFSDVRWTELIELSSPALRSSKVNFDDYVELEYGLPTSQLLFGNSVIASNGSSTIEVPSTAGIAIEDIVFVRDTDTGAFTTREVIAVPNNSHLTLSSNLQFGTSVTLTVTSVNGTFANGVTVYQANSSANVATGVVYFSNSSTIKVNTVTGEFNTSNTLFNQGETANASVTVINRNGAFGVIPELNSQYGAFLYTENGGIARYVTPEDTVHDTYKTFAIKFVPVAENFNVVPRVADMRAIALQI